jgi:hypothetical protein
MDLREQVIRQGIESDAAWAGRYAADSLDPTRSDCSGTVALCIAPYIALIVHESSKQLAVIEPTLVPQLSPASEAITARGRNSLKLFEDTNSARRGIDGQLTYFRDEIRAVHTDFFINRAMKWFRFLARDLGLFTCDSRLITTSQVANFHFGVSPGELFKGRGPAGMARGEEQGRYFGLLGAQLLTGGGATFLSRLDPLKFGALGNDVTATTYYERVFEGAGNADLNALLTVFRCMANFASVAIPLAAIDGSIDYTEFKIRFVTGYQVLSSLRVLRGDAQRALTARAHTFLARILDTAEAQLLLDSSAKPFRNTVMHYALDSRLPVAAVDLADPLFGLAPYYFPSCGDATDLAKVLDRVLFDAAAALDDWAELS